MKFIAGKRTQMMICMAQRREEPNPKAEVLVPKVRRTKNQSLRSAADAVFIKMLI